jgi:hypothetical protein
MLPITFQSPKIKKMLQFVVDHDYEFKAQQE